MVTRVLTWIMRFILLGMIYLFLYKVIKVMYSDLKGGGRRKESILTGIEVIEVRDSNSVAVGTVYPLHRLTGIGRMDDNNIVLDSKYVSNYHARIYLKNNDYIIKDMDSTNGTFLNGRRLEAPAVIKAGDTIDIGGIVFKVI